MKVAFTLFVVPLFSLCFIVPAVMCQGLAPADSSRNRLVETRQINPAREGASGIPQPSSTRTDTNAPDTEMADRVRALEEALQSQNGKIDEMQRLIAEQQQTIQTLTSKSAANVEPKTLTGGNSVATTTVVTTTTPVDQSQTPTLDDRVKKLEGQVLRLGPFRLSGDFRLRFDAISRAADPTPPAGFAPLTHQQNARARYRFRLNLDTDINAKVSFHGQLATGPINNPLTNDQDFTSTVVRHPFFINEAWIDYHPNKAIQLQGGRVQEVFADNSRFLFDDDVRFNGFNEKYVFSFKKAHARIASVELRAGQYIFSNPNVAIVTAGSPLAQAGAEISSTGRSANLFHQGLLINQQFNKKFSQQIGGDVQLYRNPNQIQLASTANGVVLIVQPGLGLMLSGPVVGTGNATTTPGGAIYTAQNFQIARLTYRLNYAGFKQGDHLYPITFNAQVARNIGTGVPERDALLAALQIGKITKRGDMAFLYVFSIKGANSLISQLTDDDLGTNSGINIRTNHFRFEYGIAKKITLQSLIFLQRELRNSGQFPNFFVPLNAFTPRQYRFQEQIVFTF
jgi:TolA-binding protein